MEIKDIAGLSGPLTRIIDCLDKGVSSLASPFVYKRMEKAKLLIEQKRADQNAVIALKDAMTQDLIAAARTTRDRQEIENISSIYGNALRELQSFGKNTLPPALVKPDWAAHFFDSAKDCCDEEVQLLWSKILAGEIKEPGKYYKRTLANLKQMERHEAEWFCRMCKYVIDGSYLPVFAIEKDFLPFNEYQSLVDCGFLNADYGSMEIVNDSILHICSVEIELKILKNTYHTRVATLTDTGLQICELVQTEPDDIYVQKLIQNLNESQLVTARVK